jgi:hypothetical protein
MSEHDLTPTVRKDGTPTLPARAYLWPPFEPGNMAHLTHGANSPRVVEAVARIVRDDVVAQAPWIVEPIFGDALARYCRAEARARLLSDHIFAVADEHGPAKVPQRLWESAVASDTAASKAAAELGVTPLARARLAALTATAETGAASLAALQTKGAEIVARRASEVAQAD